MPPVNLEAVYYSLVVCFMVWVFVTVLRDEYMFWEVTEYTKEVRQMDRINTIGIEEDLDEGDEVQWDDAHLVKRGTVIMVHEGVGCVIAKEATQGSSDRLLVFRKEGTLDNIRYAPEEQKVA